MKKALLTLLLPLFALQGLTAAIVFNDWFSDATLRLDYILSGDNATQHIALQGMSTSKGWAGRRVNLDMLLLAGNGQITLQDAATGMVIYKQSFSTLFQEWQHTEEATQLVRAFESTQLVPMPLRPVRVTVSLSDAHRKEVARLSHDLDPADILIRRAKAKPGLPLRVIERNGSSEENIDLIYVAEGYTAEEMGQFYKDVETAVESLFAHEPFKQFRSRFNIMALAVPSERSSVSEPLKGQWHETPAGSHFSTLRSDRYLMTDHLFKLHDLLEGLPFEHIIILANTPTYGGGGIYNMYMLTTARHREFRPVVVHEFGHSFAGLADEYFYDDQYETYYPADTEPWEPNLTTLHDFRGKWEHMVKDPTQRDKGETGIYEGGGYQSKGVYRAAYDCRMRTNSCPVFCSACQQAIKRVILFNIKETK